MVLFIYFYSYMKQFILPALVNLCEIEKFHMKRKLNQEEIDAKLRSMKPEARLRKGPALSDVEFSTWLWRLKQPKKAPKHKMQQDSKILEEVLGKNQDWSHLSKRRRASRVEQIESDIKWAKQLLDIRMQERVEKAKESEKAQAEQSLQIEAQKLLALEEAKLKQLPTPSSSDNS
jgi:hypothetical protein